MVDDGVRQLADRLRRVETGTRGDAEERDESLLAEVFAPGPVGVDDAVADTEQSVARSEDVVGDLGHGSAEAGGQRRSAQQRTDDIPARTSRGNG